MSAEPPREFVQKAYLRQTAICVHSACAYVLVCLFTPLYVILLLVISIMMRCKIFFCRRTGGRMILPFCRCFGGGGTQTMTRYHFVVLRTSYLSVTRLLACCRGMPALPHPSSTIHAPLNRHVIIMTNLLLNICTCLL